MWKPSHGKEHREGVRGPRSPWDPSARGPPAPKGSALTGLSPFSVPTGRSPPARHAQVLRFGPIHFALHIVLSEKAAPPRCWGSVLCSLLPPRPPVLLSPKRGLLPHSFRPDLSVGAHRSHVCALSPSSFLRRGAVSSPAPSSAGRTVPSAELFFTISSECGGSLPAISHPPHHTFPSGH